MLDPVIYALSHAAFGVIALMALGYVVMLAGKLEERNVAAEASVQPGVVANLVAHGAASVVPHYVYVYSQDDAKALSGKLYAMRTRLTIAYIACLSIAFLVHSPDLRSFVGFEQLALVKNAATVIGLPETLMAPFGFTVIVVLEVWSTTRKYLLLLRKYR